MDSHWNATVPDDPKYLTAGRCPRRRRRRNAPPPSRRPRARRVRVPPCTWANGKRARTRRGWRLAPPRLCFGRCASCRGGSAPRRRAQRIRGRRWRRPVPRQRSTSAMGTSCIDDMLPQRRAARTGGSRRRLPRGNPRAPLRGALSRHSGEGGVGAPRRLASRLAGMAAVTQYLGRAKPRIARGTAAARNDGGRSYGALRLRRRRLAAADGSDEARVADHPVVGARARLGERPGALQQFDGLREMPPVVAREAHH